MSRPAAKVSLSADLKALIAKPEAMGAPPPAPPMDVTAATLGAIRDQASSTGIGRDAWLVLCTAAVCAIASPETLCQVYDYATRDLDHAGCVEVAAIMRETGIKCIPYSGAINNLNALRAHIPDAVAAALSTTSSREPCHAADVRGETLWTDDGIYSPHADTLAAAHPDLVGYILNHYASLVADPDTPLPETGAYRLGRTLTALLGAAAVRATGGTTELEPYLDAVVRFGSSSPETEVLTTEDALVWIIESVDRIGELFNDEGTE